MKKYIKPTIKTCRLIDTLGYALSSGGGKITSPILNEGTLIRDDNYYGDGEYLD